MKIKRIILFIGALLMSASMMMAQSSGDKLYNQGLKAQKTMTVKAQNEAIQKFSSAKKLYDSASKKAQCDRAIEVSRNIISSLKSGGGTATKSKGKKGKKDTYDYVEPTKPQTTLSLTNKEFNLDASTKALKVGVNTNEPEWSMVSVPCDDGSSFLTVVKITDDEVMIDVPANMTTIPRMQKIQVKAGNLTEDIVVSQAGKPILLTAKSLEFSFKEKGGKKDFEVNCNADQVYPDNGYENWYVESQPDWVKLIVKEDKKKKNFFDKIGEGVGNLINGPKKEYAGNVTSKVTLIADPLRPGSVEAQNGRKGEIILCSGDQKISLLVYEYGKLSIIP